MNKKELNTKMTNILNIIESEIRNKNLYNYLLSQLEGFNVEKCDSETEDNEISFIKKNGDEFTIRNNSNEKYIDIEFDLFEEHNSLEFHFIKYDNSVILEEKSTFSSKYSNDNSTTINVTKYINNKPCYLYIDKIVKDRKSVV